VRVHLAGEHAREFELPHALLVAGDVAHDLGEARFVLFGFDQCQQFAGVREPGGDLVEFGDGRVEFRPLAAERLGLGRQIPDRRIAELVVQFLEPLAFFVVFKGTPSAPRGAE
jgi:hypothetical protein